MKAQRETDIQADVLKWLTLHGIYAWRNNSGGIYNLKRGCYLPYRGAPGASDVLGVLPGGVFLAVEVKRPGKKPTTDQAAFLERINLCGGVGIVVTSIRDLENQLDERLRPRRA